MKKLIKLFLILNLILPNGVYAATYYSTEKINYTTSKPTNKEYEEEYRYKFYEEEKIYSEEYYVEDFNDGNYPYRSNEFIQTDFTSWSKEKPIDAKGRVIKTKEIFEYAKRLPIRYLYFYDINGSRNVLRFLEIKIYHNEEEISYDLECQKCNNQEKLNDNNYDQGYTSVLNSNTFVLDLKDYYDLDELKLEIYLTDNYGTDKSTFRISALNHNKQVLNNYIDVFLESNMYNTEDSGYRFNINLKDHLKDLYYEENTITKEEKLEDEEYKLMNNYLLYSYQDVKYKYYKIERLYLDGYYVDKKGYKIDIRFIIRLGIEKKLVLKIII